MYLDVQQPLSLCIMSFFFKLERKRLGNRDKREGMVMDVISVYSSVEEQNLTSLYIICRSILFFFTTLLINFYIKFQRGKKIPFSLKIIAPVPLLNPSLHNTKETINSGRPQPLQGIKTDI